MNPEDSPDLVSQAAGPADGSVTLSIDAAFGHAQKHHEAGRFALAEGIYLRILKAVPDHPRALYLLGVMAMQIERHTYAEEKFRAVLRQRPNNVYALANLAAVLVNLGRLGEVEALARRAIELDPSYTPAHSVLGRFLLNQSRHAEAVASYGRAVALNPDDASLMTNLLYCMVQDDAADPQQLAQLHREFGRKFGANLRDRAEVHPNVRDPGKRLRVGFVSGDLRRHAVAYFVEPVWRALDRGQFELFAYSNLRLEDATSQRLKHLVDQWRPVLSLSDAQLAQQIKDDGIDILIDLSGHTMRNRLLVFARKPAPVQASWIGYRETTGLTAIDYYLCNVHSTPPPGAFDSLYVEKLVRLPAGAPFEPDPLSPAVNPLPALQRGHLTFGSFNRLSKLGESVFATWSGILSGLPDSRLLLANVTDATQEETLRQRFAAHGVSSDRLSFVPRMALVDYLALHHEVDVLLDAFPYTGGTTTQHALWMGVPTITLTGLRRSERVGTGIMTRVGLADWCVASTQEYVARAIAAAQDIEGLAALRAGLRERVATSPLRQSGTVTRSLELALRIMWQRWCDGLPAQAFSVDLEQALGAAQPASASHHGGEDE